VDRGAGLEAVGRFAAYQAGWESDSTFFFEENVIEDSSDGAEPARAYKNHVNAAVEHLFQQAELLAAGEDATGFGGIFTQAADNPNSPPATEKAQARRGKPAAVQRIGGAQNPEQQSQLRRLRHAAQCRIVLGGWDQSAMPESQIGQGAALFFTQGEIGFTPDHAGAHRRMLSFIDGPANIVDERGDLDEPDVGPRQIMKRQGGVNQGKDIGGNATLMANLAKMIGCPVSEPSKL
jgi:hypothetical protein